MQNIYINIMGNWEQFKNSFLLLFIPCIKLTQCFEKKEEGEKNKKMVLVFPGLSWSK